MSRKQKIGSEKSATRTKLLDAAEAILREEGYAAVTTRRIGTKADLTSKLVHYYFPSMDDLFLALYRRTSGRFLEQAEALLEAENPIRVLWQTSVNSEDVDMFAQLMALGQHRKAIQEELNHGHDRLRALQLAALDRYFQRLGVEPPIPTAALLVLLVGAGLMMANEQRRGHSLGHAETVALFERLSTIGAGTDLSDALRPGTPPENADP